MHIMSNMVQSSNSSVRSKYMERIYKTMRNTGACRIAAGIVILVAGVAVGIVSIVSGSILLKRKSEIMF